MKKLAVLFCFSIMVLLNSCGHYPEEPTPTGLIKMLDSGVKFEIYGTINNFNKVKDTLYVQEALSSTKLIPKGSYFIPNVEDDFRIRKAVLLEIYNQNGLKVISSGKNNSVEIGEDNQFNNVTIENSSN